MLFTTFPKACFGLFFQVCLLLYDWSFLRHKCVCFFCRYLCFMTFFENAMNLKSVLLVIINDTMAYFCGQAAQKRIFGLYQSQYVSCTVHKSACPQIQARTLFLCLCLQTKLGKALLAAVSSQLSLDFFYPLFVQFCFVSKHIVQYLGHDCNCSLSRKCYRYSGTTTILCARIRKFIFLIHGKVVLKF